uniref:Exonuclease 3'-5' domain containing 1 n=1 Tax=Hucho hucho TaxID=62062 RepID=A0A4W5LQK4_9TELE
MSRMEGIKLLFGHEILNDDNEIDDSHVNFVVIDEFHEKLGPAIAAKNKGYLFDILLLGARAFKNSLSMILENNHILKVTYSCRRIAGRLRAQFGVNVTNVYDTQVADILCFYTETGGFLPDRVSTLQEVVKMPSSRLSSLKIRSLLSKEDKEVWYIRPCPASLLKIMALSVIHLQPLRLADYTGLVDSYLSSSQQCSGAA